MEGGGPQRIGPSPTSRRRSQRSGRPPSAPGTSGALELCEAAPTWSSSPAASEATRDPRCRPVYARAMAIEPEPPRVAELPASRPIVESDGPSEASHGAPDDDLVPELSGHAPPPHVSTLREQSIRSGAGWLIWIAALSLVNIGATASGSEISFALGLIISQVIALIGAGMATETHSPTLGWVAAGVAAVPAIAFGALWFLAKDGKAWVFVLAMVVYALDLVALLGILAVAGEMDFIGVGIHVWALWALWRGWSACREPA